MYNNRNIRNNYGYGIRRMDPAEAASRAIYNTISMVEDAVGITFPRGSTPSESRAIMVQMLRSRASRERKRRNGR